MQKLSSPLIQQLTRRINLNYCTRCTQREFSSSTQSNPLTKLSDEEQAIKDLATKISQEKIAPLVKQMDQNSKMEDSLLKTLFDNGVYTVRLIYCHKIKNYFLVYGN